MGIKKIKENGEYNSITKTFLIDSTSDFTTIETNYNCDIGDIAISPDGTEYIRHSNDVAGDKWVKYSDSSGGGGGGTIKPEKDVNLYDSDGNIIASYTKEEFANLSSWPEVPSRDELTAQGWNWNVADAKAYVAKYGELNVSPTYITESGNTEIDVNIIEGRLTPYLGIAIDGEVEINWGDNSNNDIVTGSSLTTQVRTSHTYQQEGEYTISIIVKSGSFAFYGTSIYGTLSKNSQTGNINFSYASMIQAVRIGDNITTIDQYSFYCCINLKEIFIPENITLIGQNAFYNCYNLVEVTIPKNVTLIKSYAFRGCVSLEKISLPNNTILDSGVFSRCSNFKELYIPEGNITIGSGLCGLCTGLKKVIIPDGITEIKNEAFFNCESLVKVKIPSGVTTIEYTAFSQCSNLKEVEMPNTVTSMGKTGFQYCTSLVNISISSNLTILTESAFSNDYNLLKITIPSKITTIESSAFYNCYGLTEIHFSATVPPLVSSSDTFLGIPTDCKIYVPTGTLSAYTSATNYPSASTYTYIEE